MPLQTSPASATQLAQMRRYNKKLEWMPRFKNRNRVTPRVMQTVLRNSEKIKKGPADETR
ncbi:hypothetical protein [Pseudomonas sp. MD330_10]|uniref:hypothetical protein n=1 Tax=Pseudomonas sp. MD330_10 TaxID=3241254 RepID=UPI0036D3D31C